MDTHPAHPGATVSEANLKGISAFLAENLGEAVERWELCAFNNLCRDKYERLGLVWKFADTPLMTQAELDQAGAWAKARRVCGGAHLCYGERAAGTEVIISRNNGGRDDGNEIDAVRAILATRTSGI